MTRSLPPSMSSCAGHRSQKPDGLLPRYEADELFGVLDAPTVRCGFLVTEDLDDASFLLAAEAAVAHDPGKGFVGRCGRSGLGGPGQLGSAGLDWLCARKDRNDGARRPLQCSLDAGVVVVGGLPDAFLEAGPGSAGNAGEVGCAADAVAEFASAIFDDLSQLGASLVEGVAGAHGVHDGRPSLLSPAQHRASTQSMS